MSDDPRKEPAAGEIVVPPWGSRRVLLVDDEEVICKYLERALREHGCEAAYSLTARAALEELSRARYAILVADIRLPDMSGIELLRQAKELCPETSVIMITAHGSIESAIEAMKLGASDYLTKPFKAEEFCLVVDKVLSQRRLLDELAQLRLELAGKYRFEEMISQDPKMREVFATIARVAATDTTVLITGETGTGKELAARAIHYNSPRRGKPLLAINCGAFPETLLESELFGHEQGAFTGAVADKPGIFEVANGGSLLLDEIGNIPHSMQVKLLRFLESGEFKRVGGTETRTCDVRIIAATHVDLTAAVASGAFRRDLFYRVNVVPIVLPPLRERVGDIPLLVEHFIRRHGPRINPAVQDISRPAMNRLLRYPWPGNIRQLEHVIQRALIMADGPTLLPEHISLDDADAQANDGELKFNEQLPLDELRAGLVERLERAYLDKVLRLHRGNVRKAARHAGLSERSIHEKLKRYAIDRRAYNAPQPG